MFSDVKSVQGSKMAQVFTNSHGYDHSYPMMKKSKANFALTLFLQDAGIPPILVSDNAPKEIHG